jgi:hypothetical protein
MANKLYFGNLLLILFSIAISCKHEKKLATAQLNYTLTVLNETDSSVSLKLAYLDSRRFNTPEGGTFYTNFPHRMLVSIVPVTDSTSNFLTRVLSGNSNSTIDSLFHFTVQNVTYEERGAIVPAFDTRDSLLIAFSFTINKKTPYLLYSTFRFPCVVDQSNRRDSWDIQYNENIVPKNIENEFAMLQRLMDSSFPTTNSQEVTNSCFQITDSYTFYRDRPVKLLYFP